MERVWGISVTINDNRDESSPISDYTTMEVMLPPRVVNGDITIRQYRDQNVSTLVSELVIKEGYGLIVDEHGVRSVKL